MRADRLVATLLLLQARGQVTASQVATELEVSERTARRDLDALAVAGLPVYATRGRGGGWALLGGARTDLTGLTDGEACALLMAAGPAAASSPEVKAALRKLLRALPEPFRDRAQAAAEAVVVDAAGWRGPSREPPAHLASLQAAVVDAAQVELCYVDRSRAETRRAVAPLGLVNKRGTWYLVADTPVGRRTFRLDRVTAIVRTGEEAARPPDFDLAKAWRDVVDGIGSRRPPLRVRLQVADRVLGSVRWVCAGQVLSEAPAAEGHTEVSVTGESPDLVARKLAGFGDTVLVLEPEQARAQLAALGRELTAMYG